MALFILGVYGVLFLVALGNFLLMRRPGAAGDASGIRVLIPARDEVENLRELIPILLRQGASVIVFDDESSDRTGQVAGELGARVIRPSGKLPTGWAGKNRACHELAVAGLEDPGARWLLFLDADVRPKEGFLAAMAGLAAEIGDRTPVITGFPEVRPGRGIEPLFLAWVGWILLATNPFGLVSRTGMGHNRFTNGQVHMWRADVYRSVMPNERMKGRIMEDVMIGRLLAREGIRVETANLSHLLSVKMYETWRETLDGMSKNSYEVTGSAIGTVLLALLFLVLGWVWLAAGGYWWVAFLILTGSGLCVVGTARTALWPALLMPLVCTIGAFTMLRSLLWRRRGAVRWKGRTYFEGADGALGNRE